MWIVVCACVCVCIKVTVRMFVSVYVRVTVSMCVCVKVTVSTCVCVCVCLDAAESSRRMEGARTTSRRTCFHQPPLLHFVDIYHKCVSRPVSSSLLFPTAVTQHPAAK